MQASYLSSGSTAALADQHKIDQVSRKLQMIEQQYGPMDGYFANSSSNSPKQNLSASQLQYLQTPKEDKDLSSNKQMMYQYYSQIGAEVKERISAEQHPEYEAYVTNMSPQQRTARIKQQFLQRQMQASANNYQSQQIFVDQQTFDNMPDQNSRLPSVNELQRQDRRERELNNAASPLASPGHARLMQLYTGWAQQEAVQSNMIYSQMPVEQPCASSADAEVTQLLMSFQEEDGATRGGRLRLLPPSDPNVQYKGKPIPQRQLTSPDNRRAKPIARIESKAKI